MEKKAERQSYICEGYYSAADGMDAKKSSITPLRDPGTNMVVSL